MPGTLPKFTFVLNTTRKSRDATDESDRRMDCRLIGPTVFCSEPTNMLIGLISFTHCAGSYLAMCPSKESRRDAKKTTKPVGKMTLVAKATFQSDLSKRQLRFDQYLFCAFEPPLHQIVMRRRPDGLLECADEIAI
jgi:hypothetical protein